MAVDGGVFSWRLAVVCSHGCWRWCVLMAVDAGVFSWRLMVVCSHGGWRWCVLMAVGGGVFSWRLMLVCSHGGWRWCVLMAVGGGVFSWRLMRWCVLMGVGGGVFSWQLSPHRMRLCEVPEPRGGAGRHQHSAREPHPAGESVRLSVCLCGAPKTQPMEGPSHDQPHYVLYMWP